MGGDFSISVQYRPASRAGSMWINPKGSYASPDKMVLPNISEREFSRRLEEKVEELYLELTREQILPGFKLLK